MLIYGLNDKKKTFCKKNFVEKFCVFIFKFIFLPCEKANSQGFFELCKHFYHSQSVKFAVG